MWFYKRISVKPNQVGYLYKKNKFKKVLEPGIYNFWDFKNELDYLTLSTLSKLIVVTNQEVLTQDNIALRFSYIIEYKINNGERFLSRFNILDKRVNIVSEAENVIHNFCQVYLRKIISQIDSQELNERKNDLLATIPEELINKLDDYGIIIEQLIFRDITFPKMIQELFAKQLEAKIKGKTELENARTTVATARALKNASELMKDDDNIKFLKFLEAMTQIAAKGNHTFVVGDLKSLK